MQCGAGWAEETRRIWGEWLEAASHEARRSWAQPCPANPGTAKMHPAPSPQPSRSTTLAQSNRQGSSPGATATTADSFNLVLPPNPESATRHVNNGEDSLKGGDGAKTDKSDTEQSMPAVPTYGSSTIINIPVHGGTGGSGGPGGAHGGHGGHGGRGEGPKFTFPNSTVNLTDPDATRLKSIKEKLANHIAAQHKFTDQSKTLCADNTRVEIQAEIARWLAPQPSNRERILWITGIAGSGKSTLSATVVDNLRKNHTPVTAQFFISRNIPETIDPSKLVPTIAKQLAESSPAAAHIIHDTLKNGFPPSREEQVKTLLLAPIRELSKSCDMVIILIDALDELQNAAESVLEILLPIAPRDCDLPDNVRFIITSRPERWADISRSESLELQVFKQHTLTTASSVNEVHNFIVARMKEITPRDWDGWPPEDQLLMLAGKADGLFHYAGTALQWIKDQIREHNESCRPWVLDRLTQMGGLDQLQDLYKLILTSFENIDRPARIEQLREDRLHGFQHVIGTILVLREPLTIGQIIALLANIQKDQFDVKHFLEQFRSVLVPGMTASFEEATPQMHKSFRDYIMNAASPEFRILSGQAHFMTARSCLEVIVMGGSQSDIHWNYSARHWPQHLRGAVEEDSTLEDERMWELLGQMVEQAIDAWAGNWRNVFVNVAAAGEIPKKTG
ncbi:hypothetical protein B0H13DRAFT_1873367 [Mycena leptocephala]|nr:hypothetical protein B0H13DRAFT_1873367 [Mycena leptocephala]